jgi:thioredoxin-related protein
MKKLLFLFLLINFTSQQINAQAFQHDIVESLELAKQSDKQILMIFSGSDWCKPCILLKETILTSTDFIDYSADNLVLLEVDFPYRKKNRLPKEQQEHNDALAEKYNKDGVFPRVILLDNNQNALGLIEYEKDMDAASFIAQIQQYSK